MDRPYLDRTPWFPRLVCPLSPCGWRGRLRAIFVSRLLVKLWLPTFLAGICCLFTANLDLSDGGELLGAFLGIAVGMVLHELGHACTCIAYGGQVSSWGLTLLVILPGAFVELDVEPVTDPLRRAQIFAAGVEMNLALTGIFLLVSPYLPSTVCLCAATSNFVLALFNLTLVWGLDGSHILSSLLGVEDVCSMAKEVLMSRGSRRHLGRQGIPGKAALAFCFVGLVMQLCLPLVLLINLSEVILWFL